MVTFVLLSGYPPFYGDTEAEIFAAVKRGVFEFRSPEWDPISDLAKDFIRSLLQKDPAKRPTPQVRLYAHSSISFRGRGILLLVIVLPVFC